MLAVCNGVAVPPRPAQPARPAEHSLRRILPIRVNDPRRLGIRQAGPAILIAPGTIASNPFQRDGIAQARAAILFRAWLAGELSPTVLRAAKFSDAEVVALRRWRRRLLGFLPCLRGRNLRCTCPPRSQWCHGDTLIRIANP